MQIDREYEERSQCDAQVLTSRLNSLASKSLTNVPWADLMVGDYELIADYTSSFT